MQRGSLWPGDWFFFSPAEMLLSVLSSPYVRQHLLPWQKHNTRRLPITDNLGGDVFPGARAMLISWVTFKILFILCQPGLLSLKAQKGPHGLLTFIKFISYLFLYNMGTGCAQTFSAPFFFFLPNRFVDHFKVHTTQCWYHHSYASLVTTSQYLYFSVGLIWP